MRLSIRIPQDSELKQNVFEDLVGALHSLVAKQSAVIVFGMEKVSQNVTFFVDVPDDLVELVKSQLFAFFPDFQMTEIKDSLPAFRFGYKFALRGKKHRKIKLYKESDIRVIPSIISELPDNSSFKIYIKPILYDLLERMARDLNRMFVQDAERVREDNFFVQIAYFTNNDQDRTCDNICALLNRLCNKDTNSFVVSRLFEDRFSGDFVFARDEVATVFYFPYKDEKVAQFKKVQFSSAEPPEDLPTTENTAPEELSIFGVAKFRDNDREFGIKRCDRNKHFYIVGKSGMGKTWLLKLLMMSDISNGKGFALIDPHGDSSKEMLALIPKERLNDVVFFNCPDFDYPVGFNPFMNISAKYKHLAVDSFVEIFAKLFGLNWNSRLEHILRYSTIALLDNPEPSLLGLKNLLTDKDYRQFVISNTQDPVVKAFWANEFAEWKTKYEADSVLPLINKLSQLLANPIIRNIFIQTKNTVDIGNIINTNKILICNLSEGEIGEVNSSFIGAMLVTKIQQCAMERAAIDKETRKDFYLYVDEFQNFATDSFIKIFSEARKYNLCLTVANQYIKQLPESVCDTVFGNVGSMAMFRVGVQDADFLLKEFSPPFTASDMVNLGVRDIYIKLCIDGKTSKPFLAETSTLVQPDYNLTNEIIEESRRKYTQNVSDVETEFDKQDEKYKVLQDITFEEPII